MPKELVTKDSIPNDPCLMIVKAFRIANKRCGEAKRANNAASYNEHIDKLRFLSVEAETRGFKIWVNEDGKTGHTYAKDYKPSEDATNDFAAFEARAQARMDALNNVMAQAQSRAEAAEASAETAPDDTELDNEPEGEGNGNNEIPM